ncbi:type II toxin-antitoxin system HicA family toxin [Salmonella enterica]|uniref:type II toxin-antitoxin system HicA family toxin n=1 Tax=Salmonella enterica TaxID=28901 RepID=UPI001278C36B|nr:type II toxin-antitoxin system HicA family toxin [Salmonella enterica]ECD3472102.1 type II toxin-antitoxin system HicA family toxin [Salmonella enterica subsp. enterica serovar Oranienburg]EDY1994245.1 type II toxin-antitoxin system HicA family toxin [Salmonella enterica subsp. diarizonae]EED4922696.1 type II toxin-antitoxin system HicA family toxin [Salmonella enterica subsp. arizonae]EHD9479276.1 type II toxin-antitoxin system HicA family toxin [Salmonella enterica subsp. enterica serovar 
MSSAELIKRLIADGWVKTRQNGSHVTLTKPGVAKIISVPHPRKDSSKGVIRQAQEISGLRLL